MKEFRKSSWTGSRPVMFVASSVWVTFILVIFVFRGGGAVPVPIEELRPEPSVAVLKEEARALTALGDYEGAWYFYHRALLAAPEHVSLWYALGVTLSHLNHETETAEAFQYVVRQGDPHSEEVRLARQWLVKAGVLAERVHFASASAAEETAADRAVVRGQVTWGEPHPARLASKVLILLEGLDGDAEGKRFDTEVALGEPYQFENLPTGSYHLTGGVKGQRLWDLTLTVRQGEQVTLHLSKESSSNPAVALHT